MTRAAATCDIAVYGYVVAGTYLCRFLDGAGHDIALVAVVRPGGDSFSVENRLTGTSRPATGGVVHHRVQIVAPLDALLDTVDRRSVRFYADAHALSASDWDGDTAPDATAWFSSASPLSP
jgi:hypothetical protein